MVCREQRSLRVTLLSLTALVVFITTALTAAPSQQKGTLAHLSGLCDTPTTPFCDAMLAPPSTWMGKLFKLRQDYPARPIRSSWKPWKQFDPQMNPREYLDEVLKYVYEGNIRVNEEESFDLWLNEMRDWYNVPWQVVGRNGREPIHGLSRERTSMPGELAQNQRSVWNNYATSFYNAVGATTIGEVWQDHGCPNPKAALLDDGTVAVKLLFTTASLAEVPYLSGAPQWTGYIYSNPNEPFPAPGSSRTISTLRLLQVDVAVKDARVSNTTGWVFATFVYGGGPGGKTGRGWYNVSPVGLMWGNRIDQSWINPEVRMPHLGADGRLSGPVDNPQSSCLSCHSTAQVPQRDMTPRAGASVERWFRNVAAGTPFDDDATPLDYSLLLSVSIANHLSDVSPSPTCFSLPHGSTGR